MKIATIRSLPVALVATVLVAGAGILSTVAVPVQTAEGFSPQLAEAKAPAEKVAVPKVAAYSPASATKKSTKIVVPKKTVVASSSGGTRMSASSASAAGSSGAKAASAPAAQPVANKSSSGTDLGRAQSILNSYKRKYPILQGATVKFGDARGHQAICYYSSGRIVISPKHKASLERIIAHEIWHIIDWRDNGKINWGESVPPKNASSFAGN